MVMEIFHTIDHPVDLRYAVEIPERRKDWRVVVGCQADPTENGVYRVVEWHDGRGRLAFDEATVKTAGLRGDAVRAAWLARFEQPWTIESYSTEQP